MSAERDDKTMPASLQFARLLGRLDHPRRVAEQNARLRLADQRLMWLFSDGQQRAMRDVAAALNLELSTVNRQVNAALTAGLLERSGEPGRAARLLSATDEGLARFQHDRDLHLRLYGRALDALAEDQQVELLALLGPVVEAYREAVSEETWVSPSTG